MPYVTLLFVLIPIASTNILQLNGGHWPHHKRILGMDRMAPHHNPAFHSNGSLVVEAIPDPQVHLAPKVQEEKSTAGLVVKAPRAKGKVAKAAQKGKQKQQRQYKEGKTRKEPENDSTSPKYDTDADYVHDRQPSIEEIRRLNRPTYSGANPCTLCIYLLAAAFTMVF